MKCVLKMAEFPLAAELHSHVFRGGQTGGVRESKMAARLHIIRLFPLDPTTSHLKKSAEVQESIRRGYEKSSSAHEWQQM